MVDVALTVRVVTSGKHPAASRHTDRMVTASRDRDHVAPTSEVNEAGRVVTHTENRPHLPIVARVSVLVLCSARAGAVWKRYSLACRRHVLRG